VVAALSSGPGAWFGRTFIGIAEGTMTISEWTSMGTGDVKLKPSLARCKITAAPAK
jgi:hypothetical protein